MLIFWTNCNQFCLIFAVLEFPNEIPNYQINRFPNHDLVFVIMSRMRLFTVYTIMNAAMNGAAEVDLEPKILYPNAEYRDSHLRG